MVDQRVMKKKREKLYRKHKGCCTYCKAWYPFEETTIDHITPRSKGGRNSWDNITLACAPCNRLKADKPLHEFKQVLGISFANQ